MQRLPRLPDSQRLLVSQGCKPKLRMQGSSRLQVSGNENENEDGNSVWVMVRVCGASIGICGDWF